MKSKKQISEMIQSLQNDAKKYHQYFKESRANGDLELAKVYREARDNADNKAKILSWAIY